MHPSKGHLRSSTGRSVERLALTSFLLLVLVLPLVVGGLFTGDLLNDRFVLSDSESLSVSMFLPVTCFDFRVLADLVNLRVTAFGFSSSVSLLLISLGVGFFVDFLVGFFSSSAGVSDELSESEEQEPEELEAELAELTSFDLAILPGRK